MGNAFGATERATARLYLSNGGTNVFFDVLTIAGCALAEAPWEQNLVLHFADGHRVGRGLSGFDLDELPWTANCRTEHAFLLRLIDAAASQRGWDMLNYDPPYAMDYLATYRVVVTGFTPTPAGSSDLGDWREAPRPEFLERCSSHHLYRGEFGCRLCDTGIQPR